MITLAGHCAGFWGHNQFNFITMNTLTKDALVEAIQGIKAIKRTFLIESERGPNNSDGEYTWTLIIQEVEQSSPGLGKVAETLFYLDKIVPILNEAKRVFLVGKKRSDGTLQIIVT